MVDLLNYMAVFMAIYKAVGLMGYYQVRDTCQDDENTSSSLLYVLQEVFYFLDNLSLLFTILLESVLMTLGTHVFLLATGSPLLPRVEVSLYLKTCLLTCLYNCLDQVVRHVCYKIKVQRSSFLGEL